MNFNIDIPNDPFLIISNVIIILCVLVIIIAVFIDQLDKMPKVDKRWRHIAAKDRSVRLCISARLGDNTLIETLKLVSKFIKTL